MGVFFVGLVPSLVLPPTVTTPRRHPLITLSATSTELAALAAIETKTAEDREKILGLSKQLEAPAASSPRYLDAPNLVGNYELLYFDKSVDGGRDGKTKPKSIRRRVLGLLFQNRGSFQHIVDPGLSSNFYGFPASPERSSQRARLVGSTHQKSRQLLPMRRRWQRSRARPSA